MYMYIHIPMDIKATYMASELCCVRYAVNCNPSKDRELLHMHDDYYYDL